MSPGAHRDSTERQLSGLYRLVSELLLSPGERRAEHIASNRAPLIDAPTDLVAPIDQFLASARAVDVDEHLLVLELTPPCPLYLGTYMFDEPRSCNGAGFSGRNGYMIELAGTYRHFGFEVRHGELADFIPAMVEFLAISLDHPNLDGIGLRRRFVERFISPGLEPMRAALAEYDSPYGLLVQALEAAVAVDIAIHADGPFWVEPVRTGKPPAQPIITFRSKERAIPMGEQT